MRSSGISALFVVTIKENVSEIFSFDRKRIFKSLNLYWQLKQTAIVYG
jgi:hypothetical protein